MSHLAPPKGRSWLWAKPRSKSADKTPSEAQDAYICAVVTLHWGALFMPWAFHTRSAPPLQQLTPWALSGTGKIITESPPRLSPLQLHSTQLCDSIVPLFALSKEGNAEWHQAGSIFLPPLFYPFPQHLTGFWHQNQTASSAYCTWPLGFLKSTNTKGCWSFSSLASVPISSCVSL